MTSTPRQTVYLTSSEGDTIIVGEHFATRLRAGDIVSIEGDLGAGKTRFVKGIARGLGHDPSRVASPTFAIAAEHDTPKARCPLIHIDAYRLSPADALDQLGLEDTTHAVLAIEWASRLENADERHPAATYHILIEHSCPQSRSITITALEPPQDDEALSSHP